MSGRPNPGVGVALLTIGVLVLVGLVVAGGTVLLSAGGGSGPADVDDRTPTDDPGPSTGIGPDDRPANHSVTDGYDRLHEQGITGEGVSVGVVDVTGYDPTDPQIQGQVREARSFGSGKTIRNGGRNGHGTAAARIVSRAAPGVDLYLANFDSPGDFQRAVSWLLEEDVDVIVAPVSFYGQFDDGSAAVSRAATRASERGVVFVAPVGNLAEGHWEGRYDGVENGTLRFESGHGGRDAFRNEVRGDADELTLWLSWDRAHADENYSAVLYRRNGSSVEVAARSEPYREDGAPNERIVTELDEGSYFVVVEGPDESTGARLEVTTTTHRLEHRTARGSIAAPATARGVVAVGAYDRSRGAVAPFSSRGPTADGRPGVDVVAPGRFAPEGGTELVGSSAGAPHVAGVAALVLEANPALPPGRVAAALELTAVDAGPPGYDVATGHGLVAPVRAVDYATADRVVGEESGSDGNATAVESGGDAVPDASGPALPVGSGGSDRVSSTDVRSRDAGR